MSHILVDEGRSVVRKSVSIGAAVLLLLTGVGAYAVMSTSGRAERPGSSAPGADGRTPPPLALDQYVSAGRGDSRTRGSIGIGQDPWYPYGLDFRPADGLELPAGPGSAPVYALRGQVTKGEVTRLARALGMSGTPQDEGQHWRLRPQLNGSGGELFVDQASPGAWSFSHPPSTYDCPRAAVACPWLADRSGQEPAEPEPVGEAAVKRTATALLQAIGQSRAGTDAGEMRLHDDQEVDFHPTVGGLPTYAWTTTVRIGHLNEVVFGKGLLKAPVKGHTYPVVNAGEGLDLLNEIARTPGRDTPGKGGVVGCPESTPAPYGSGAPRAPRATATASPPLLTDRETVPAVVERADLVLAPYPVGRGQMLVPTWLFEARVKGFAGTTTFPYPAVAPSHLTAPTYTPEPSPCPSTTDGYVPPSYRITGYRVRGRELTLAFEGDACADYEASATEVLGGRLEVRVTLGVTMLGRSCVRLPHHHRTVLLPQPLGGRDVVDENGKPVPEERPGA